MRHEPRRLIDSSMWGASLFPSVLVKEVMAKAASENKSLAVKWDLQPPSRKRDLSPRSKGAYAPKHKKKKGKASHLPSTSASSSHHSSPAVNPKYEKKASTSYHSGGQEGKKKGGQGQPKGGNSNRGGKKGYGGKQFSKQDRR